MMKMNQSGQAFSVFKLLIAAIVAVFILALLLQILSNITPPSQGDPTDEAASKIKTLLTKLGTPERTAVVTFQAGQILSARTIASKTGALDQDNVCVMVGSSDSDNSNFETSDGTTVVYSGNSNVQRRLYIICDLKNEISNTISSLSGVPLVEEAFVSGQPDCSSPPDSTSDRYCIVSVIPTGT